MPASIEPNAAHRALVALEDHGLSAIVTQNVDGLHQAAGSSRVYEVHGSGRTASCPVCAVTMSWDEAVVRTDAAIDGVPRCRDGHPLKPDVVLFEEDLPPVAHTAMAACHDADLIIAVGTSLRVYPVAGWPRLSTQRWFDTRQRLGRLAIVCDAPTGLDHQATIVCRGSASAVLTAAVDALTRPS